jgi:hypothetical protein
MRLSFLAVAWVVCMTGAATAQRVNGDSIPIEIGNHANGFNFQPTPDEVYPREVSAGLWPSKVRQAPTDQTLEDLDRSLLRSEGLSTENVPVFTSHR